MYLQPSKQHDYMSHGVTGKWGVHSEWQHRPDMA